MHRQQSLFGEPEPPPHARHRDRPIVRASDAESSKDAARNLIDSGRHDTQCVRVAELVRLHPGRTAAELARIEGEDRYMVNRRLSQVERRGLVRRGEVRVCEATGNKALEWYPVLEGER